MGSKSRIAESILPIIQQRIKDYNLDTYIEPFCGGCNIIDKVVCDKKIASDNHKYLIAMFQNSDKLSSLPNFITKEHYSEVRACFNGGEIYYPDWYIGAVGFLASYNGRFFDGGYAGLVHTKANTIRNYYDEAKRNLLEQIPKLQNIDFAHRDYKYYTHFEDCVFYLDPPYKGVKQYGSSKDFDHDEFWNWAKCAGRKPDDFCSDGKSRWKNG